MWISGKYLIAVNLPSLFPSEAPVHSIFISEALHHVLPDNKRMCCEQGKVRAMMKGEVVIHHMNGYSRQV